MRAPKWPAAGLWKARACSRPDVAVQSFMVDPCLFFVLRAPTPLAALLGGLSNSYSLANG
jgi:hypothetical protein